MGHFYNPPQPFVGGRQPLAPDTLPPSLLAVPVDNPPFIIQARFWSVYSYWQQAPLPMPQGIRYLAQPGASGPADAVIYSRSWMASVVASWSVQPPPLPTLARQLSPGIPGQSVDPPPGASHLVPIALGQEWSVPPPRQFVVQSGPAVAVQPPVVLSWLPTVVVAWQPPPPDPQRLNRNLVQPGGAAVADAVLYTRSWLSSVGLSWQPGPPDPQRLNRNLIQEGPAAAVQPPYALSWLAAVALSWQPSAPEPQRVNRNLIQEGQQAVVQPPFSRTWLPTVMSAWVVPAPHYRPRYLPASSIAVQVDNPPFGLEQPFAPIYRAWLPPDPARVIFRFVTESGVAIIVDPDPTRRQTLVNRRGRTRILTRRIR